MTLTTAQQRRHAALLRDRDPSATAQAVANVIDARAELADALDTQPGDNIAPSAHMTEAYPIVGRITSEAGRRIRFAARVPPFSVCADRPVRADRSAALGGAARSLDRQAHRSHLKPVGLPRQQHDRHRIRVADRVPGPADGPGRRQRSGKVRLAHCAAQLGRRGSLRSLDPGQPDSFSRDPRPGRPHQWKPALCQALGTFPDQEPALDLVPVGDAKEVDYFRIGRVAAFRDSLFTPECRMLGYQGRTDKEGVR